MVPFCSDALILSCKSSAPHSSNRFTQTSCGMCSINSAQAKMMEREKAKTNSAVWKHFGFKESNKEQQTLWKICYTVVSTPQGDTTNLFNCLKCNHKVVYDQTIKEQKTERSPHDFFHHNTVIN